MDVRGKVEGRKGRVMSRKRFSHGEAGGGGWIGYQEGGAPPDPGTGSRGSAHGKPGTGAGGDPRAGGAGVLEPRSGK